MKQRCNNPRNPSYADYGGRGIRVCKRWEKFENFLADMGERPPGMTLDRKNNARGYSPGNCRWATRIEQNRNSRHCNKLTHGGQTKLLTEWAEALGISPQALWMRIQRRGWPGALETRTYNRQRD